MRSSTRFVLVSALAALSGVPALAQAPANEPAAGTPATAGAPAATPAPYLASGPQELFAKGVALMDRGAVQEAKTVFKALTLAYPELPEPHINLAVLLAAEGGLDESAEEAEAAIRAHPLCRAAFDLEFQRQIGLYGTTVLGGTPAPPPARVPATPTPSPSTGGETRVVRQAADPCLNFRPRPTATAAALECLPPGTRVRLIETAGDWSHVALANGRKGWMASSFLGLPDS